MKFKIIIFTCIYVIFTVIISSAYGADTLSLQQAIELARNNNPIARARSSETKAAKAGMISARSGFLPNIEVYGGVSYYVKKPGILVPAGEIGNPTSLGLQTSDKTVPEVGVELKQIIYDFGRTSSNMKAASADRKMKTAEEELYLQDLSVAVTRSYLDVLLSRESKRVAVDTLDAYKSHLFTAKQLFDVGSVSRSDLLAAEIAKSKAELELTSADNKKGMAELSFEKIVGVKPRKLDNSILSSKAVSNLNEDSSTDIESAKQRRNEVAINEARQQEIMAKKQGATSQYLPKLFGEAKAVYTDDKYKLNKDQYYFGVGLSFPVFDGLRAYGERRKAIAELEAAKMKRKHIEDQIELDVTQAKFTLQEAHENVSVASINEARASENLRTVRERYKAGDAPASEVLDAIAIWKDATLSVIKAKCSIILARAYLARAQGVGYAGEDYK